MLDGTGVVAGHVDGDTLDVDVGGRIERIRLVGIDTPELARDGRPAECHADAAAARLAALLPIGTRVRIERDIVPRDDYGRLLGYLHVADPAGTEQMVNLRLVLDGVARPMSIPPNDTYAPEFVAAARRAERAGAGLWSECRG